MTTSSPAPLRLTSFSHGGGCGCKIAPGVLSDILKASAPGFLPPQLMVGIETADDAAVWRLNDEQALIATTDFFMLGTRALTVGLLLASKVQHPGDRRDD